MKKIIGTEGYEKIASLVKQAISESDNNETIWFISDNPAYAKGMIDLLKKKDKVVITMNYKEFVNDPKLVSRFDRVYIEDIDKLLQALCPQVSGYIVNVGNMLMEIDDNESC